MEYTPPKNVAVGDELGVFNLGSTVVLLTEAKLNWAPSESRKVKMGEIVS